jgi:hypothetical protein
MAIRTAEFLERKQAIIKEATADLKRRSIKRLDPEKNPESSYNKIFLVTRHCGNRAWVVYHGNNANIVKSIGVVQVRNRRAHRKAGDNRMLYKKWQLINIELEPK